MDLPPQTGKSPNSSRGKDKESTSLIKASTRSNEHAGFQIKEHFVDDYQHYPAPDQRFTVKSDVHYIVYSLCKEEDGWSQMIAEDVEVTILLKTKPSSESGP